MVKREESICTVLKGGGGEGGGKGGDWRQSVTYISHFPPFVPPLATAWIRPFQVR